jgi:ABC-type dipeptide/oligopeptide/nickel transport system permease component
MKLKGSWRTTALGIAALITAIIVSVIAATDGNPETVPAWDDLFEALKTLGVVVPVWLMGLIARDKNVSSEEEGLK